MRRLPQTNFDEKLALIYENMTQNNKRAIRESRSNDLTDLVAHSEHIADDLAGIGYEDDELVSFVETYIQTAIETVLDNPEWFRDDVSGDDLTDLVAHSEHIADDLAEIGYEDDELVSFVQTYIQAAIETVLDNPEWFHAEENAEERNWRDELNRAAERKARERNASINAYGGPGDAEESDDGRSYNTSKRPSKRPGERSTDSESSKRPRRKNWRDDLERAAERRNRGIIARGGPGDAEPTDGRRY